MSSSLPGELVILASPLPRPAHGLGPVNRDWEAAEVWLQAIASRPKKGSPETVATNRYDLAKLRWYCENASHKVPSQWTMPEVTKFFAFLGNLPEWAICAHDGIRHARLGEPGYTPFRLTPSASSRSDIQRCIHAMFRARREIAYIAMNPFLAYRRACETTRDLGPDSILRVIKEIVKRRPARVNIREGMHIVCTDCCLLEDVIVHEQSSFGRIDHAHIGTVVHHLKNDLLV